MGKIAPGNQPPWLSRTRMLLGDEAMERLAAARVAVFGIGGVGGYVVEALARSGIGSLDLIDNDQLAASNLNRQVIATLGALGRDKVDVAADRVLSIHPSCRVTRHKCFFLPETADRFDFGAYDYVVDAIDTVTGKIQIVLQAQAAGVPVISAMGTGNKLDPSRFEVADIYETSIDPLARVMRRELKKRGVRSLKVVYSKEPPMAPAGRARYAAPDAPQGDDVPGAMPPGQAEKTETARESGRIRRPVPGSVAFVPSVAGLIMAGEVIRDLAAIGDSRAAKTGSS